MRTIMKKKILAAAFAAMMVMSMTGVSAAAKAKRRMKERLSFTEPQDTVKRWEMQD